MNSFTAAADAHWLCSEEADLLHNRWIENVGSTESST
jgi:hypothetical protein